METADTILTLYPHDVWQSVQFKGRGQWVYYECSTQTAAVPHTILTTDHAWHQHLRDYVSTIAYLLLFACLLVPVTEAWRNELQNLTQLLVGEEQPQQPKPCLPKEPEKPRTLYSAETGRLIPPPSRAMSRAASRRASRHGNRDQFLHHIAAEPDMESMVCFIHNELLQ